MMLQTACPRYFATFFRNDRILGTRPCDRFEDAPGMTSADDDLKGCDRIDIAIELPILDGSGATYVRVSTLAFSARWPFVEVQRRWERRA